MGTNLAALQAAIKLIADLINDGIKAAEDNSTALKIEEFANIFPDILNIIPMIGQIPQEAQHLKPEDYASLIASLGADLALPEGKVANIVAASVKLLSDFASVIAPDIEAIIVAAKS